jgi:hypothetical protein
MDRERDPRQRKELYSHPVPVRDGNVRQAIEESLLTRYDSQPEIGYKLMRFGPLHYEKDGLLLRLIAWFKGLRKR